MPVPVSHRPLRLAIFSPVPPVPSGISDYLVDLLPLLPERWTVDLFVDDGVEPAESAVAGRARCYPHSDWESCRADRPYDLNIYQFGNDTAHLYMIRYVLQHPGMLVLHDGVVHPLRVHHAVETGDLEAYRSAALRCRPDVGKAVGHLVVAGLGSPSFYFLFPFCEDLVRASLLTGVHGELLAGWLQALVPEARVASLVHWRSVPEATTEEVNRWRRRLGADASTPLVGCFGHLGPERRLDRAFDVLGELATELPFKLAVVGEVDAGPALADRLSAADLSGRTEWLGRVSGSDFGALLRAADLAVNLRYPPARSSSGVLHQLLQAGVPTVITDLLHWRDYPSEAVARVPPGPESTERDALRAALHKWISQPGARAGAARVARRWSAAHLNPEGMAASYVRAVGRLLGDA